MARSAVVQIIIKATNQAKIVFDQMRGQVKRFASEVKTAFSGIQGAMAGLGFTIGAGAAVAYLIKVNAEFAKLQARLQTFTGSAGSAKIALDQLTGFADSTPFDLNDVTEAFIQLRLAGIQPTMETLTHLGDLATANGMSLMAVGDAVRDAQAGATRGLKQMGVVAKAEGDKMSLTFQGVTTTVNNSTSAIINYLETLGKDKFAGAMERQAGTLGEAIQDVKEAFDRLARSAGQGGITGAMVEALQGVVKLTDALHENGSEFGYWVNLALVAIKSVVSTMWNAVRIAFNFGKLLGTSFKMWVALVFDAVLEVAKVAFDTINLGIEAINKLPGVEIKARAPDLRETVQGARDYIQGLTEEGKEAGAAIYDAAGNMGLALLNLGDAFVNGMDNISHSTADAVGVIKELGTATDTNTDATVANTAAQDERLKLLLQAIQYGQTHMAALVELAQIEADLTQKLKATNLTLAERLALEERLKAIREATGISSEPTLAGSGPTGESISQGGVDPTTGQMILRPMDLAPSAIPPDAASGIESIADAYERGLGPLYEFNAALEQQGHIFDGIVSPALSGTMDALFGMSQALLNSIPGHGAAAQAAQKAAQMIAKVEGGIAIAKGGVKVAESLFPPNPLGISAGLGMITHGMQLMQLGGGGGGYAGGRGGGRGGSAGSSYRDSEEYKRKTEARGTIIVQGGLLDMSDPRQAEALMDALSTLDGERRIEIKAG